MVKYSREPATPAKAAKARGKDMRVHFKNTYETADAIRGMQLEKAIKYLEDVIEHKRCIPFRVYSATAGRTAQAHQFNVTQGMATATMHFSDREMAEEVLRARAGTAEQCQSKRRVQGSQPQEDLHHPHSSQQGSQRSPKKLQGTWQD